MYVRNCTLRELGRGFAIAGLRIKCPVVYIWAVCPPADRTGPPLASCTAHLKILGRRRLARPCPTMDTLPGNRLLQVLPQATLDRLAPEFETVPIRVKDVLHQIGRPVEHVYFPHSGMGSIVTQLKDGTYIEAATIGNEGILGAAYVLGDALATEETMIQLPGEAIRLRVRVLRAEFDRDEVLRTLLLRYSQILMGQIAQGSACNRVHPLEGRCARWLLSTHDRVAGDEFPLTHEFLAMMLGVRRAGVSVAQHKLQQDGLIRYTRGNVTIVDREGLEATASECYEVIRSRSDRFLSRYREGAA
jgi:CRP-like cAMP-binding protein